MAIMSYHNLKLVITFAVQKFNKHQRSDMNDFQDPHHHGRETKTGQALTLDIRTIGLGFGT
jgi:hypothetical protein